jgi:hypothetical protein
MGMRCHGTLSACLLSLRRPAQRPSKWDDELTSYVKNRQRKSQHGQIGPITETVCQVVRGALASALSTGPSNLHVYATRG